MIQVRNLRKHYGGGGVFSPAPVRAVDDVSFRIEQGETLGLVGESGCGKTTLGRTLIQLETPTAGQVLYEGTDVTTLADDALHEFRENTQMVFQDPESSLNDRMTVGEIVREPLDVHEKGAPQERRRRVRELLGTVGLRPEHYYRYPHQFSGGQRQRVGIARALALDPGFVVLDEPVSALDVSVQAKILNLLNDLQDELGLTFLFIAHDLSVVRHICDRVAVMYLGKVMEIGETEELFRNPQNPYTYSLLSSIPTPDPTAESTRITLRGTPPSPRDPPAGCPFSTRCPVKIRPDEHADLDPELWARIETFRAVVRERTRADRSLGTIVRELLGREARFDDVGEVTADLFGDVEVPADVQDHIETAADLLRRNDADAARAALREAFAGTCDLDPPEHHSVSETGRTSYCHRHTPGQTAVGEAFNELDHRWTPDVGSDGG